jgi:hypothetical protein
VKGSPNGNPLAFIHDHIPSILFLFTEKEEEEERQAKPAKVLKQKLPRKIKQKNIGRKSMYVSDCC